MNLAVLPANPQEGSQHHSTQVVTIDVHRPLYELHLSLMNYFCSYLTYKERTQATRYIQNERWRSLDWENPKQPELETAAFIRKQVKELLEQESRVHGRETSSNHLLTKVFSHLWTFLLINGTKRAQRATPTSHYHDQEWQGFTLSNRRIKDDCEAVAHILEQQTGLVQQHGIYEGDSTFQQLLRRIVRYLEELTRRTTRHAQPTCYDDDREFEELDWKLR